jgi:galactokinase
MQTNVNERMEYVTKGFREHFPDNSAGDLVYISSPGRMEILGNHTDHQHGYVITSAVSLDKLGAVQKNGRGEIRLLTEGYSENVIDLSDIRIDEAKFNSPDALICGVVAGFRQRGYDVGGFDAFLISDVLNGSGLSSSASFEVWIAEALNVLYCGGEVDFVELAKIGQYAENIFYGKPSGLEDQTACAGGGILFIDFENTEDPKIEKFDIDLSGYTICIVDSLAEHDDLTHEYAAIPAELGEISARFGKRWLREVDKTEFIRAIPQLRRELGDRAVLRAFHIFEENERVLKAREALARNDRDTFFGLLKASGESSFMYLQNVSINGEIKEQPLAIVLALAGELLRGDGAFRIQGGGFAGTVEAFVPDDKLDHFVSVVESVLGKGSVHILSIRTEGANQIIAPPIKHWTKSDG